MQKRSSIKKHLYKLPLLAVSVILAGISLVPVLLPRDVSALGQISSRKLTLSSGVPSATGVTYTFNFTLPTSGQVQGLKFIACKNAVGTYPSGTCVAPTGMTGAGNGFTNAAQSSQSGWSDPASFAVDSVGSAGSDCVAAGNIMCVKRSGTTAESGAKTIAFNTIKNPSQDAATPNGTSFYVGVYTYTTNTWTLVRDRKSVV
jgi:hypothetical protein